MRGVAVGGESAADIETGFAAGDYQQYTRACDRAHHLGYGVRREFLQRKALADYQSYSHRGIEMTPRNMTDRVGHGQNGKAERKRDSYESDTQAGEGRSQHSAAASTENQPEGT